MPHLIRPPTAYTNFGDCVWELISAGIVLTGGASKTRGVVELAEQVFQLPIRLGMPQNISGMAEVINNPVYATGVGLLLIGYQHYQQGKNETVALGEHKKLWAKMKSWFKGNF